MKIQITQSIELSKADVETIFRRRLSELKEGHWTQNGKLMTEGATSHRFDYEVRDNPNLLERVLAVEALEKVLKT